MAAQSNHETASEESKPLISLDLHAEAGTGAGTTIATATANGPAPAPAPAPDRQRGRRQTIWDRQVEDYKVTFNKTIAGRYKEGETGYDEIGVLLITWEKDDLQCRRTEVPRLRDIFERKFGYTVEEYQIPSRRSETGLAAALANFAHRYDSPNKMAIVYYGGHGDLVNQKFGIYAKMQADGEGDPSAFLDDALQQLKLPDTDILTIIDCCYAARAFSRSGIGKRKFELLAATPASEPSHRPDHEKSFTKALCDTLEELLVQFPKGFTTAKLYQQVYFKQEDDRKPLLFDQSIVDYGKIWLRPFGQPSESPTLSATATRKEPVAYIDLRLKLPKVPEPITMNDLAVAMQYLPHVEEVSFQNLHAPHKQLEEFMSGVRKAMLLRPLVARLRLRRTFKLIRERGISAEQGTVDLSMPLHTERRGSAVYDWSESKLQHLGKARAPTLVPIRTDSPMSMHVKDAAPDMKATEPDMKAVELNVQKAEPDVKEAEPDLPAHNEALKDAKVHRVGSLFSFVYVLDISGLKALLAAYFAPVQDHVDRRQHTKNENIMVLLYLVVTSLICFAITQTRVRDIFYD